MYKTDSLLIPHSVGWTINLQVNTDHQPHMMKLGWVKELDLVISDCVYLQVIVSTWDLVRKISHW